MFQIIYTLAAIVSIKTSETSNTRKNI